VAVGAALGALASEYTNNREYYKDFIRFNFFNGIESDKKSQDKVQFFDTPKQERPRLSRLYRQFGNITNAAIYRRLNVPITNASSQSPLEIKWVFAFYKKYGHWKYFGGCYISDRELLQPLDEEEAEEFLELFD
jgi:hypothetical protein